MPIPRGRLHLLLAALALRAGQFVSTEELIDHVWGEEVPPGARTTLRAYIKRLRARLREPGAGGEDGAARLIEARPGGYLLAVEEAGTDLHGFRALWARATSGEGNELAALDEALALWRGKPLAGLQPLPWVVETASGLTEEWLRAVERRADLLIERGGKAAFDAVAVELRVLLAEYPFRESLWRRHILALHLGGRSAEALLRYDEVRRLLADQLGVEPSASLRSLYHRILTAADDGGEPDIAEPGVPSPPSQPPRGRQPGETGDDGAAAPRPELVGRRRCLAALDALLDSRHRPGIIVVDGPAGVGKTALARYWAASAAGKFPGGPVRVNLRGFHSRPPLGVREALARLLQGAGVGEAELPRGLSGRSAMFTELTAARPMLVLLDNAHDAEQVRHLLPASGSLAVVTSQRQLRGLVAREGASRLTLGRLDPDEGVQLVTALGGPAVTGARRGEIEELVELCAGLPLALRIAVEQLARVPSLTPAGLAVELRDERSRLALLETGDDDSASIRGTLGRAHQLLGPGEATLLGKLAQHAEAEFGLDDAAALLAVGQGKAHTLLNGLVSLNLVEQLSLRRYRLPCLQRAVAGELLPKPRALNAVR
ncbi:AfsR/SARP family transcriptional regulator [Prauserella marina]|uniref:AfsR/SARP family transcriptional regulator n=1 Tax=Prauserella marina TaxID=530584 RepID=UPI0014747FD4|nr:BTAD domain-containing putative transcriptional regulator [Prauserella marina]